MRIPCWRVTFKGTVTLPISSGNRYAQVIQTRHPEGTNAGAVTEDVTLTWCGAHVEIAGKGGIALIPAGDVTQADAIVVDGRVVDEDAAPRKPAAPPPKPESKTTPATA